jgi:hypothetical protein
VYQKEIRMGWALMVFGLLLSLAASAMLLMGVIQSGAAVAMGILGIGLIAVSGRWMRTGSREKPREEQIERTIYAPDRQLRALIRQHTDGNYRIEIQKFVRDYSPDVGSHDRWERQSNVTVTDTLSNAVEIAARSVGAGTDDFFGVR